MEEMNKEMMENTVTEVVEEVTDKISFKDNCVAYGLAGVFVTGAVTIGYLSYKGAKKLAKSIKDKKKLSVQSEETVVDVENDEIHEVMDNESEE